MNRLICSFVLLLSSVAPLFAADSAPETDRGPFFSGTILAQYPEKKNTAMKGIVVTVGKDRKSYVCYDTDLLRVSLGWTGSYLNFGNSQTRIEHPQPPSVAGTAQFGTRHGPGWAHDGTFDDPRPNKQGPLPKDFAHYRGLYLHGREVILSYTVGSTEILETPGVDEIAGQPVFTRTLQIGKSTAQSLLVCEEPKGTARVENGVAILQQDPASDVYTAAGVIGDRSTKLEASESRVVLQIPASNRSRTLQVAIWHGAKDQVAAFQKFVASAKGKLPDLAKLAKSDSPRWTETLTTSGTLSTDKAPYVADILSESLPNPWNAKTFFGGFDFFPDGRAAICTFHGDVWVVSGINDKLDKLTWKRFATGMFQPLGLKIVNNTIYVTCRDQINRLHDLNKDGEADFYENFNNDCVVTDNYHEFCLDLDTDSDGNFYYCKGSPWPPDVRSPHQGVMFKLPKDGSKLEVFATGLRAPNGMAIGPHNEITVSDNQGHWMPASKLNLVKKGGFYGMVPAAHRESVPTDYDKPICWLPMDMDSSSGGQAWVTSDKWGPLKNHLLFTSYGKGTLFHVMTEDVDGVTQGAMVRFPLKFDTGLMRARFNPKDGQLYVCGLRGWQTAGTRDGGFYRVRYMGQKVYTPLEVHAQKNGIRIKFSEPLDDASATSAQNYSAEEWNYKWTSGYGSPDFSAKDPKSNKHDRPEISGVQLSADKRTVFLQIPEITPADQMKIRFKIKAADGTPINQEIYNTIYKLAADQKLSALR